MNVTQAMVMDLAQPGLPPRGCGVRGDSGRSLRLDLRCGGAPWPVPEGAELLIRYRRRDGTGGCYDTLPDGTKAWSAQGSLLTVQLAPQVCAIAGQVELDLTLMKEGKQISTFPVELRISQPLGEMGEEGSYVNLASWLEANGGADGVSVTAAAMDPRGHLILTLSDERTLDAGRAVGTDGRTPVRGADYWTAADIAQIQSYVETAILGGAW